MKTTESFQLYIIYITQKDPNINFILDALVDQCVNKNSLGGIYSILSDFNYNKCQECTSEKVHENFVYKVYLSQDIFCVRISHMHV